MRTRDLIIICLTIILIVGGITFAIWSERMSELPYEQCLESCIYSDKITCTKLCNADFKETIELIVDKVIPLAEKVINQECGK